MIIIAVAALAAACNPAPSITINPSSIDAPSSGGSYEVTVTSNYDWTATPAEKWIKVSPSSGAKGTATIKVTVSSNSQPDGRTSTIAVACEGLSQEITVTQGQKDMLQMSASSSTTVSWLEQTVEFQLSANIDYEASVDPSADWLRIVSSKAMTDHSLVISVTKNDSTTPRETFISFTSNGTQISGFTFTQEGRPQIIKIVHNNMVFNAPTIFGFGASGTIQWGDGASGIYKSTETHTYETEGEHEITIEAINAATASLPDFVGLLKIDLTDF